MRCDLKIVEGISGVWHYHLARDGKALCGARTMPTGLRLNTWGFRSDHLHETYCRECESLAGNFRQEHE